MSGPIDWAATINWDAVDKLGEVALEQVDAALENVK